MFALFLASLLGMSVAGLRVYNQEQLDHDQATVGYTEYLTTDDFIEVTFENWESEFLQMAAYVMLTVFLFQRGSAESKDPDNEEDVDEDPRGHRDDPDAPWPVRRGGMVLTLYENSLFLAFAVLFLLSMLFHAIGAPGSTARNRSSMEALACRCWRFSAPASSGTNPSRTGRANSWLSERSWSSPSFCGSEDRRSRSRSRCRTARRKADEECRPMSRDTGW